MAKKKKVVRTRRRERKNIAVGHAHVLATFNNTIVSLTDPDGNVIAWGSAGAQGFKGSRKSTPFAAQVTAEAAAKRAMEHGLKSIEIFVKGPGAGREAAIRSLQASGLDVSAISDVYPDPAQRLPPAEAAAGVGRGYGKPSRSGLQALPSRRRQALSQGRQVCDQLHVRQAQRPAPRSARSRPPSQGERLRHPAARQAEGAPSLRRPRDPVSSLLRACRDAPRA